MTRRDYEFMARFLRQKREEAARIGGGPTRKKYREREIKKIENALVEALAAENATFKEDVFRKASQPRESVA